MLRIIDKNDTSLSLHDHDEVMLAFQGEVDKVLKAYQLFHDTKRFRQAGNHGLIVKELSLEGQRVYVVVTPHHNGGVQFRLSEPKLLVRDGQEFEPLHLTSTDSAEAGGQITVAEREFKQIALGMLVEAGLISAEEAVKGGYVATGARRRSSTPSTDKRQR